MIGVWPGRQMEELMAQSVNEELVDKLPRRFSGWDFSQAVGSQSKRSPGRGAECLDVAPSRPVGSAL
jgi:hypothetical protein